MARSYDLERAVGVVTWALLNKDGKLRRPLTPEEAVAKAHQREPHLTDADMANALRWAQGAIQAAEATKVAAPTDTLADILDKCGVPWRE